MRGAKGILTIVAFLGWVLWPSTAPALNAYSSDQQQQFMNWCTGAKSATETTCSCTVKRLAQTVAPAALAQFVTSQTGGGGFSISATAATTAALVTEALVGCSN